MVEEERDAPSSPPRAAWKTWPTAPNLHQTHMRLRLVRPHTHTHTTLEPTGFLKDMLTCSPHQARLQACIQIISWLQSVVCTDTALLSSDLSLLKAQTLSGCFSLLTTCWKENIHRASFSSYAPWLLNEFTAVRAKGEKKNLCRDFQSQDLGSNLYWCGNPPPLPLIFRTCWYRPYLIEFFSWHCDFYYSTPVSAPKRWQDQSKKAKLFLLFNK